MSRTVGEAFTGERPANHAGMRRTNRAIVLDHLRRAGVSSRSDIVTDTGLAAPTVSMIVGDLVRERLVTEVGRGRSGAGAGRPRVLLRYNAHSSYLLAVHVGVLRTTVVIGDALGATLTTSSMPTPKIGAKTALHRIAALALDTLDRANVDRPLLAWAGVSLPGLVDQNGVLLFAPNLGWRNVPVAQVLSEALGVPVVAANTTNATLVAEEKEGAARGERNVVLIYAGTGTGAAVIADGRLITGARGIAGEFGHVRVVADGDACSCGKKGCLETLVSAQAVGDAASALWRKHRTRIAPLDPEAGITAMDVALAAGRGDATAVEVFRETGARLGASAAWLVNMYNPSCLILAGGLAGAGEPLFEPFRSAVEAEAMPEALVGLNIRLTALGQEAEVRGTLLLAAQAAQQAIRQAPV